MKGGGFGLLGNIVVGVVGAVIGDWLFGLLGIYKDFQIEFESIHFIESSRINTRKLLKK